jgi:hypothetical protein
VNKRIRVSPAVGGMAIAIASLGILWVGANQGLSERLGRYGISAHSTESSGMPGAGLLGLPVRLSGESYGAGASALASRRFLARRGQELILDYDLAIVQGRVRVTVNRVPVFGDELWGVTVDGNRQGTIRLPIPKTGIHQLTVTQFRYTGTYDLEWRLE